MCVCVCDLEIGCTHCAVKDHAVSIAQALDVCCQVEADGSMANGIHGLSVKEVMRSGCREKLFSRGLKKNEAKKKNNLKNG